MILIAGQAGVGKTTLAHLIAKEVFDGGQIPVLLSFAGSLKAEAARKGYTKEEFPDKYREYCQSIGASKRVEDEDYWVKVLDKSVQENIRKETEDMENSSKFWERVIIIDDCRYLNELGYSTLYNAVTLFLSTGNRVLEKTEWREHESELLAQRLEGGDDPLVDAFTDIVYNDGPLGDLQKVVKANAPFWAGKEVPCDAEGLCTCVACKAARDGTQPILADIIESLADILFLSELKEELENEVEEEDETEDEETQDSDT